MCEEANAKTPILLCSATGYDASGRVEDLAANTNRQITSIAIGSSEGFKQAEQALESASNAGRWVLLKNVHLAPSWLTQLEKRLHNLKPNANFRLLLTAEIHPKLPVTIIQVCASTNSKKRRTIVASDFRRRAFSFLSHRPASKPTCCAQFRRFQARASRRRRRSARDYISCSAGSMRLCKSGCVIDRSAGQIRTLRYVFNV